MTFSKSTNHLHKSFVWLQGGEGSSGSEWVHTLWFGFFFPLQLTDVIPFFWCFLVFFNPADKLNYTFTTFHISNFWLLIGATARVAPVLHQPSEMGERSSKLCVLSCRLGWVESFIIPLCIIHGGFYFFLFTSADSRRSGCELLMWGDKAMKGGGLSFSFYLILTKNRIISSAIQTRVISLLNQLYFRQ